jgi:hypothetical protein
MDTEKRAELHQRLDRLIDLRERVEALYRGEAVPMPPLKNARDAYTECLSFAADVCGPTLAWASVRDFGMGYAGNTAVLLALRDRLTLARPLLESPGGKRTVSDDEGETWVIEAMPLDIEAIGRELLLLAKGDVSELFAPLPRKPGQSAKRYQLNRAKLRALEFERVRAHEGVGREARHREILDAFGVHDWERIRKWRGLCRKALGEGMVELLLASASLGILEDGELLSTSEAIRKNGLEYQRLAREAKNWP